MVNRRHTYAATASMPVLIRGSNHVRGGTMRSVTLELPPDLHYASPLSPLLHTKADNNVDATRRAMECLDSPRAARCCLV